MFENEIWANLKLDGFNNKYQVSNYGRIRIKKSGYLKKLSLNGNGYFIVHLSNRVKKKKALVHRLVAEAFIDNPNSYPIVNHKNGNKTDNRVDNLEWCTNKMNVEHAWKSGLCCCTKIKWTNEKCIELSKQCSTMTEFKRKYPNAYKFAHKTDLWKTFTWFNLTKHILETPNKPIKVKQITKKSKPPRKKRIKTDINVCIAATNGCKNWGEFRKRHRTYAIYCINNNFVDMIKEHIKKNNPDYIIPSEPIDINELKKKCLKAALECNSKLEFRTKYKHEYSVASANKWLKEYTWLTGCKGVKDEEKKNKAIEVARQCITKREFREEHPVEYSLAAKYKILKEFIWLKGCKKVE